MRNRRNFLNTLGRAAAISPLARFGAMTAQAQSAPGYKALVCIYQFGGNDSNNMVVPLSAAGYDAYRRLRGSVALASNELLPVNSAQGAFGLHPSLAGVRDLYNQGRAAAVLNVGMLVRPVTRAGLGVSGAAPRNLYSHSDQQDQWQAANPMGPAGTGWSGRAADIVRTLNTGSFPPNVSLNRGAVLQLVGQNTAPVNLAPGGALGLESLGHYELDKKRDEVFPQLLALPSGASLISSANAVMRRGVENAQAIARALDSAPPLATVFPNTGLGNQLREVARIVSARGALGMNRQIFFVSQGGYDNHDNLLPQHANLLAGLNAALSAFHQATVEMGVSDSVTSFLESEFNRTFTPNGNAGTDHAWGGHMLVVGGAVRAGVYGRMPEFSLRGPEDAGDRGLWIPSLSTDQYAATLAEWFGVPASHMALVTPNLVNFSVKNVGFMR